MEEVLAILISSFSRNILGVDTLEETQASTVIGAFRIVMRRMLRWPDVLALRKTCRTLYAVSDEPELWQALATRDFGEQLRLPCPTAECYCALLDRRLALALRVGALITATSLVDTRAEARVFGGFMRELVAGRGVNFADLDVQIWFPFDSSAVENMHRADFVRAVVRVVEEGVRGAVCVRADPRVDAEGAEYTATASYKLVVLAPHLPYVKIDLVFVCGVQREGDFTANALTARDFRYLPCEMVLSHGCPPVIVAQLGFWQNNLPRDEHTARHEMLWEVACHVSTPSERLGRELRALGGIPGLRPDGAAAAAADDLPAAVQFVYSPAVPSAAFLPDVKPPRAGGANVLAASTIKSCIRYAWCEQRDKALSRCEHIAAESDGRFFAALFSVIRAARKRVIQLCDPVSFNQFVRLGRRMHDFVARGYGIHTSSMDMAAAIMTYASSRGLNTPVVSMWEADERRYGKYSERFKFLVHECGLRYKRMATYRAEGYRTLDLVPVDEALWDEAIMDGHLKPPHVVEKTHAEYLTDLSAWRARPTIAACSTPPSSAAASESSYDLVLPMDVLCHIMQMAPLRVKALLARTCTDLYAEFMRPRTWQQDARLAGQRPFAVVTQPYKGRLGVLRTTKIPSEHAFARIDKPRSAREYHVCHARRALRGLEFAHEVVKAWLCGATARDLAKRRFDEINTFLLVVHEDSIIDLAVAEELAPAGLRPFAAQCRFVERSSPQAYHPFFVVRHQQERGRLHVSDVVTTRFDRAVKWRLHWDYANDFFGSDEGSLSLSVAAAAAAAAASLQKWDVPIEHLFADVYCLGPAPAPPTPVPWRALVEQSIGAQHRGELPNRSCALTVAIHDLVAKLALKPDDTIPPYIDTLLAVSSQTTAANTAHAICKRAHDLCAKEVPVDAVPIHVRSRFLNLIDKATVTPSMVVAAVATASDDDAVRLRAHEAEPTNDDADGGGDEEGKMIECMLAALATRPPLRSVLAESSSNSMLYERSPATDDDDDDAVAAAEEEEEDDYSG